MANADGLIQIKDAAAPKAAPAGKQYWRSLNELTNTAKFREWVNNEFPSLADDMLAGASRRNVLKLMAASFGLAGLTACRRPVERILPNVVGAEGYTHGKPLFYATAMPLGGAATGLLAEVNDGRPTKIEGNPDHPFSLGAANAFHQASILTLYDPDRLRAPMSGGRVREGRELDAYMRGEFDRARLGSGAGLRILSERVISPSLAAVRTHLLGTMPQARWIEYDAVASDTVSAGAQLAFGQPVTPVYNLEKADVVLSLDSDFLFLDSPTVLPMKQYGRRRRANAEQGEMNRLYVVEGRHSVTGSGADHRLRLRPSEIPSFAADLAGRLGAGGNQLQVVGSNAAGEKRSLWLNALVKDLNAHRGRSLVIAGPAQPPAVHALAFQMNQALGNVGSTVTYVQPPQAPDSRPQLEALRELAGEMAAGRVSHLVILGCNPAYTAPVELEFEANIKKVANSIYLAPEYDETAAAAKWSIPEAHYLEAWGDVTAPDGTVTIQQPMIQPLHGGRTAAEIAAMISGYPYQKAYDIVRATWLPKFGGDPKAVPAPIAPGALASPQGQPQGPTDAVPASLSAAEKTWRKVLHDGIVPNTAYSVASPSVNAAAVSSATQNLPRTGNFELLFVADSKVYDGRFANNGWLQELPDPMTKLTWDNAAILSPKTARELGVGVGDMVALERAGRRVEAPVMIQPGQADNLIVFPLGYGRRQSGRVGRGIGSNAYLIRTSDAMHVAGDIRITKLGRKGNLALTEEHHIIHDLGAPEADQRAANIVRELPVEEFRKEPHKVKEFVEVPELFQLYETPQDYSKGNQWGMAIDLNACTGCNACVIACQAENNIAIVGKEQVARGREMHWLRLDRYYTGTEDDAEARSQPMLCQHCETAPCENVCPVAATAHSPEGLNDMAYNRCVGTRYCSNNCPYKVRRFNYLNWHGDVPEVRKMAFNPDVTVRMRGVMEKCTYCVQRIQEKKIEIKASQRRSWITDRDNLQTACQQTCPSEAIVFGNINEKGSRVAQLRNSMRHYGVLEELNTRPRTTYLARLRNLNPELEAQHG